MFPWIQAAAAGVGAIMGISANQTDSINAMYDRNRAQWALDRARKNSDRVRQIANGELNTAALKTTQADKSMAMQAAKAESAAIAASAEAGVSSGTPMMNALAMVRDNMDQISAERYANRQGMANAINQAGLQIDSTFGAIAGAEAALGDAEGRLNYTGSIGAAILSGFTGAMQGASVGTELEKASVAMTGGTIEEGIAEGIKSAEVRAGEARALESIGIMKPSQGTRPIGPSADYQGFSSFLDGFQAITPAEPSIDAPAIGALRSAIQPASSWWPLGPAGNTAAPIRRPVASHKPYSMFPN